MDIIFHSPLLAQSTDNVNAWLWTIGLVLATYIVYTISPWGRSARKSLRAIYVIARATSKEAVRQPVYLVLLLFGIFLLCLLTVLPFFTFTDELKMMKDCGLMHILISCLFLSVWTASTSIANEIEGKTAMTLLSKPINRRQFIVGKFAGIVSAAFALWLPLSLTFMALVYFKIGYDSAETGSGPQSLIMRWKLTEQVVFPLILILLETIVMGAISVAISTRLPMAVNIVTCLVIFVIAQLTPVLVAESADKIEFVGFIAQYLATILPAFWGYEAQNAITQDKMVAPVVVVQVGVYSFFYAALAMLFSFILFEDRDLA